MSLYNIKEIHLHHDLVLVQRIDQTRTPGGIILPQHPDRQESMLAKVISAGPGIAGRPETVPLCKPGEYWLIARYIGTVFELDNKKVTIVKWADCQAQVRYDEEAERLLDGAAEKKD